MGYARRFGFGLAVAVVLVFVSLAQADGCKFPEVAVQAMPKIPAQRALIVWRDGVETLVVESSFESESHDVGWVLPLPAEPTKLDVAEPGMLTSMSLCFQPRITHDLEIFVKAPLLFLLCVIPFVCVAIFVKKPKLRHSLDMTFLWIIIFTVIIGSLFLGTLGSGGLDGSSIEGVTELSRQRVGNYDVSVLKADDSDALSRWLAGNSLKPLDAKAKIVVDDYISRKWCFAVARLRRSEGGPATPHPIAATFLAASPVYPMKMTSLAGSETHVELFVVAGKNAAAEGFECVASDMYQQETGGYDSIGETAPFYRGESTGLIIGSPDAGEFLWPGCIVTKLTADLSPQQMDHDIAINLQNFAPYRQHLYSARARREIVSMILLGGTVAVLLALGATFNKMRKPKRWELVTIIVLVGVILLGSAITYAALPVTEVRTDRGLHPIYMHIHVANLENAVQRLVSEGLLHSGMGPAELAEFPEIVEENKYLDERWLQNPLTGEEIRYERIQGNFASRKVVDKTYLCIYDEHGREIRVELPPGPTSQPVQSPE